MPLRLEELCREYEEALTQVCEQKRLHIWAEHLPLGVCTRSPGRQIVKHYEDKEPAWLRAFKALGWEKDHLDLEQRLFARRQRDLASKKKTTHTLLT